MQIYEDNLTARVNGQLQPLLGVSITVKDSNGISASLYSDDGVTPLAQPLTSDKNGYFGFYAANGKYTVSFASSQIGSFTRTIKLYDPDDAPPLTQSQAAASSGSTKIGSGGETVADSFNALQLADYTALRAYTGPRKSVYVTGIGIAGMFVRDDADTTTADNGGTVIVTSGGVRWKRRFDGPVNARWFGAKGDGVTDDTAAIQAAINYVAGLGGGVVYVPIGQYIVSDTLWLPAYVRLHGVLVPGFMYSSFATRFVTKFSNYNAWVIAADQKKVSDGSRIAYRDSINRTAVDGGTYPLLHGIGVENILIDARSNGGVYGGINLQGAPLANLKNVGVDGADVWGLISASWGYRVEQCWGQTHLYGLVTIMDAIAGYVDGYFNRYPSSTKVIDDTNILTSLYTSHASVGLPTSYKYASSGMYCRYTTSGTFAKVILEGWDIPVQAYDSAIEGGLIHAERVGTVGIATAQSAFKCGLFYMYSPTVPVLAAGVNGRFVADAFDGSVSQFVSTIASFGGMAKVGAYKAAAASAKYNAAFQIGANDQRILYVDPSSGDDTYQGTYSSPIASLEQAMARMAASSEVNWQINIKHGTTQDFTNAGSTTLINKRVRIRSYTLDANGLPKFAAGQVATVQFALNGSVLRGIIMQDTDVEVDGVSLVSPGSDSSDLSYRGLFRIVGTCRVSLLTDFTATVSGTFGVVQPMYGKGAVLAMTLNGGTVTGAGYMGVGTYASTGKCAVTFMNYGTVSGGVATNKFATGGFTVVSSNL